MSFDLLNPAMLLGLAGLSLPILAHLLSKRKYDIVQWGAMQFLELGRNTRRRIRLEELLLLLLRMGLIAFFVFALSRPWISGGMLASYVSTQSRDVAIVLDASTSMGWEGKAVTPHAAAVQWIHRFLEELRPGDTIALFEARDQLRPVIDPPSSDFSLVRRMIDELPPPGGACDLADATATALRSLARTSNIGREVIVLTDSQARGWSAEDNTRWSLLDDLRRQATVPPRIWVVDVNNLGSGDRPNFSLDRLRLSRETTAPSLPVRIETKVRYHGGREAMSRRIYFEVDGQRLAASTIQTPQIPPGGEFSVSLEHRFQTPGSHVVSLVLDADPLPGDNRADAVVEVTSALPVLLVDGDPHLDRTRSETFFARAALTAPENTTPLVHATTIQADALTAMDLEATSVVVLANVPRVTANQAVSLNAYVAGGGGLLIAAGDKVHAGTYNQLLYDRGQGVMPAVFNDIGRPPAEPAAPVRIDSSSLELSFLAPFRPENGGTLGDVRLSHWWKVTIPSPRPPSAADESPEIGTDGAPASEPNQAAGSTVAEDAIQRSAAVVAARLTTGDPLLLSRDYGRGRVALMTIPLDSDWSTLPAKPDYVPFLHELMFHLARGRSATRNVAMGEVLLLPVAAGTRAADYVFRAPDRTTFVPERAGDEYRPLLRLSQTCQPGVYTLERSGKGAGGPDNGDNKIAGEKFVVNFDRAESDLTPLDEDQRKLLVGEGRMTFVSTMDELRQGMFRDESRFELWRLLLLMTLGVLILEVWMTRRLVQGGHAEIEEEIPAESPEASV